MAKDKAKHEEDNGDVPVTGAGLEILLNRALKHCEEDMKEVEQNVSFYKTEVINTPLGKEQFGISLNDALKIKGQTRERFIKIINLFKDRVKVKEVFEKAAGTDESPERLLKAIDEIYSEDEDETN